MKRTPVLAIDGPAGTGKTTSALEVARRLGFSCIDSGALYRAIALLARAAGIAEPGDDRLAPLLRSPPIRVDVEGTRLLVALHGREETDRLRDPQVTSLASRLAVDPAVRDRVGDWLRELVGRGPAVVEGRDIGTAVFPDADLKIFLTASPLERARRRARELEGRGAGVEEVARSIAERDERDAGRSVAPLRRAQDAVEIDTTDLSIEEQVARILDAWALRRPDPVSLDYRLHQILIRIFGAVFLGMRVEGTEKVPLAGGLIFAANHKSYLDPPLIGAAIPREIHYLAKRELFEMPLLKRWVRAHNAIPVRRAGFDRAALQECLRVIGQGGAALVFPEGTRILRAELGAPREGAAWLAVRARVPIVPVLLRGTWAGQRRWLRPGGVRLRIGDPFLPAEAPAGLSDRERLRLVSRQIMARISGLETAADSG